MCLYRGKNKSVDDWCEELGLNKIRVKKRLKRGWSVEDAFKKPDSHVRLITINGVSKSMSEWCRIKNISYSKLTNRIYRNQPYEDLLR